MASADRRRRRGRSTWTWRVPSKPRPRPHRVECALAVGGRLHRSARSTHDRRRSRAPAPPSVRRAVTMSSTLRDDVGTAPSRRGSVGDAVDRCPRRGRSLSNAPSAGSSTPTTRRGRPGRSPAPGPATATGCAGADEAATVTTTAGVGGHGRRRRRRGGGRRRSWAVPVVGPAQFVLGSCDHLLRPPGRRDRGLGDRGERRVRGTIVVVEAAGIGRVRRRGRRGRDRGGRRCGRGGRAARRRGGRRARLGGGRGPAVAHRDRGGVVAAGGDADGHADDERGGRAEGGRADEAAPPGRRDAVADDRERSVLVGLHGCARAR